MLSCLFATLKWFKKKILSMLFLFYFVGKCLSIPVNPSYFHNRQTDRDVVEPHIHIVGPRAHVNTSLQSSLIRSRLCVVKSDSPRW
jgi:hypothetical protein